MDHLRYAIQVSAGCKGAPKPKNKTLDPYHIVQRHGFKTRKKRSYLDMTPEEISADMRRVGMALVNRGK